MKKLISTLINPPWRRYVTAIVLIALAVLLAKQVTQRPQASIWTWFFGSSASSVSSTPTATNCSYDMIDNNGDNVIDEEGEACASSSSDSVESTQTDDCSTDMIDNNDNGWIDEEGEPCS